MRHRDRALEEGRDPNVRGESRYANEGDVPADVQPLLETAEGHEDGAMLDRPNPVEGEIRDIDVDAMPRSEITAEGDPGGDHETIDGLDDTEEAVRSAAEDRPLRPFNG